MNKESKIFVAGACGMVGSAIVRKLSEKGFANIVGSYNNRTVGFDFDLKLEKLDLTDKKSVDEFFKKEKPDHVYLAAAKVGGIVANKTYPADFIYQNLMIQNNVIHASFQQDVKKLLFLGSSCIYPKLCPQPIREEYLMTGPLEPTNSAYAVAKISGVEMCWSYNRQHGTSFIPVMPTNLFGVHDNFDLEKSHVLPALMRKFHLAGLARKGDLEGIRRDEQVFGRIPEDIKKAIGLSPDSESLLDQVAKNNAVTIWGSGTPFREFLYVDDLADAAVFLMQKEGFENPDVLFNIGTGKDLTIRDLALTVKEIIGFEGEIVFDTEKPDGTPKKLLDVSRMEKLSWKAQTGLKEGIEKSYKWYLNKLTNR